MPARAHLCYTGGGIAYALLSRHISNRPITGFHMQTAPDHIYPVSPHWRYARPARLFHWTLAALIPGMAALGWGMMAFEESPGSGWYFALHKSIGVLVFAMVLLRLAYRRSHRPAPLPETLPGWQIRAARISHQLLYTAIIAMPLSGIFGALFSKYGLVFFGIRLFGWVSANHDRSDLFFSIHGTIIWILVALITLHVAAALKHLFIDRDGVFYRMW